jgi:lipoate-protein ligase A
MWHLLLDPIGRAGAEHMATDETLLCDAARTGRAFLRLYCWNPPCLSLGRNESALTRYDRTAIERGGIAVVRRPTGGRAVWHEHELTYAVAAPETAFGSLGETYHALHQRLATALRTLGVTAVLAPAGARAGRLDGGACFAAPAGGEVVARGRKIIGSAQLRRGGAMLQHGSILLDGSQDPVRALTRWPVPGTAAGRGETTLARELGRPVTFDEVAQAILDRWRALDGPLAPQPSIGPPIDPRRYADPAWTWRR